MALINLAQVKGGKQLQNDVSAMLKSYDAEKVLTKIAKTPAKDGAPAVNYNVEDMLNVLNQAVDALNGKKIKDIGNDPGRSRQESSKCRHGGKGSRLLHGQ